MPKNTGLTERYIGSGTHVTRPCDPEHMSAMSCNGMLSALHHQGFTTPAGQWLEVWWLTDCRTGSVEYIYEDVRGLNRPVASRV